MLPFLSAAVKEYVCSPSRILSAANTNFPLEPVISPFLFPETQLIFSTPLTLSVTGIVRL